MTLLIVYVTLALAVSFLCSVMEAVLLSMTPAYIGAVQKENPEAGARLRALRADIDRPLAAILSLNTIAHTVGAAGAGAQAAVVFGDTAVGVFSGVLTLLILVLSEIIPKTLGAVYWKTLAPLNAKLLQALMVILWPFVKMSQGLTKLIAPNKGAPTVSREEIMALAHEGHQSGVVGGREGKILNNLFRLDVLRAQDIMTPRTVVYALPEKTTIAEALEKKEGMRFSRIPIYDGNRDHISGFVLKDDILLKGAQGQEAFEIKELRREALIIDENTRLTELFERFLAGKHQFAVAVDEFGGLAGVVTMEDLVETLLGVEIIDEADSAHDMQELAREQWRRRARRLGLIEAVPTEESEDQR